jgi:hypothetical protein
MRNAIGLSTISFLATMGCTQPELAPVDPRVSVERPIAWPEDWSKLLGQKVTVDGWAAEQKLGSVLHVDKELDKESIWIDGQRWPEGYFEGRGKSKHVRVTGTVVKRDDVPVFLAEPRTTRPIGDTSGNLIGIAGIPVYSQEEFDRCKWRILLTDVTWTVLK